MKRAAEAQRFTMAYGKSVRHGRDMMGRFSDRVADLIELLEADYHGRGQRERVDEMIWEAEKDAENAEMRIRMKHRKFGLVNFESNCWKR